jgi:hypothetical protein
MPPPNNWPEPKPDETLLDVLRDIRALLRSVNSVLCCQQTQAIPHVLARIEKHIEKQAFGKGPVR